MRRDRDSENGLMEFMVHRADPAGRTRWSVTQISLNFAMFRSVFERGSRLGAGPVLRLWRSLLTFFSRWWQIESLYRANAKYRPIWEPRYMLFDKSTELPRIGIAARPRGRLSGSTRSAQVAEPQAPGECEMSAAGAGRRAVDRRAGAGGRRPSCAAPRAAEWGPLLGTVRAALAACASCGRSR